MLQTLKLKEKPRQQNLLTGFFVTLPKAEQVEVA
jgi:hypothetical protein